MKAIINATLILRDHYVPDAAILMEDGKIKAFGEMSKLNIPDGTETIDAKGFFVGPGLVDIHTHAGGDYSFLRDIPNACQVHLKGGTTSVLATYGYRNTQEKMILGLNAARKAMEEDPRCANLAGVYMEGPYLNSNFGAGKDNLPWNKPINRDDYLPVLQAGKGVVRAWTTAPERENILQFIEDARAIDPTYVFTVGHSEATPEQIERLIPYGLCIGTHHTNATGTIVNYPECRGCCVDEAVNYNDRIYAEMICDSHGIHVDPYMLRLVRKTKGDDRIILITDATAAIKEEGRQTGLYEGVDDINFDFQEEISGTRICLNQACRNMMKHTGASLVDVFKFASYNPAQATNLHDRGEIAEGKRADLIVVDYLMNVKTVVIRGNVEYQA